MQVALWVINSRILRISGIIFIRTQLYRDIFKSALVYLQNRKVHSKKVFSRKLSVYSGTKKILIKKSPISALDIL